MTTNRADWANHIGALPKPAPKPAKPKQTIKEARAADPTLNRKGQPKGRPGRPQKVEINFETANGYDINSLVSRSWVDTVALWQRTLKEADACLKQLTKQRMAKVAAGDDLTKADIDPLKSVGDLIEKMLKEGRLLEEMRSADDLSLEEVINQLRDVLIELGWTPPEVVRGYVNPASTEFPEDQDADGSL